MCYYVCNLASHNKGGITLLNISGLKAEIARNGYTQKQLAQKLGISEKTFISRLKKGAFGTDEAQILIDELHIQNPSEIFFYR